MFSLIAGLIEYLFKRAEFQVLILGRPLVAQPRARARPSRTPLRSSRRAHAVGRAAHARTGVDHAGKTTALEQMKALFQKIEPLPPEKIPPTVGLNIGRMEVGRVKLIFWDLGGQSGLRGIWEKYFAEVHGLVYVIDASDEERFEESRDTFEVNAAARPTPQWAGVAAVASRLPAGACSSLPLDASWPRALAPCALVPRPCAHSHPAEALLGISQRALCAHALATALCSTALAPQTLVKHPDLLGVPILVLANKQDLRSAASAEDLDERFGFGSLCTTSQLYRVVPVSAISGSGIADGIAWMVDTLKRSSRGAARTGGM
jgi:signal recognition particle receptor subunit beta